MPPLLKVINKSPIQTAYEELTAQGALAKKLNARRDVNTTQDFVFWEAKDSVINDYSAFTDLKNGNWSRYNGINQRVLTNRREKASFLGDKNFDYDNMSTADIAYYEDFLGFIKKAVNSVGHAVRSVATGVAHGARSVGLDIAHGTRDVAVGAAHDIHTVQGDMNKVVLKLHSDEDKQINRIFKDVGHGVEAGLKAAEPYWKVIATAVVVVVLCYTGVGIPAALAIGSAALTGLDAIKSPTPYLAPQVGDGSGGGDGSGDVGDGGDDTGYGDQPDPNQSQSIADQQAQAQADAAIAHKKKLIYIGVGVVTVIAVIGIVWWYKKHKK
jgi:hypothetical protein